MGAEIGDKVTVEYVVKMDDGTLVDTHENLDTPMEFEIGSNTAMPGFEHAFIDLEPGQEKDFTLNPSDAYGQHAPTLVQMIPRDKLPEDLEVGMMLLVTFPTGSKRPVKILEIGEEEVKVDMNHPLAGKTLHFWVKLVSIKKNKAPEHTPIPPEQASAQASSNTPEQASEQASSNTPEQSSEQASSNTPEQASEQAPVNTPEQAPEK